MKSTTRSRAQSALQRPEFDLSFVMEKMEDSPEYSGWSKRRFAIAIEEYRKYLALCKQYPCTPLFPSPVVDEVWHTHILFTKEYTRDCNDYFGRYLHHAPKRRIEKNRKGDGWKTTLRLYKEWIREPPVPMKADRCQNFCRPISRPTPSPGPKPVCSNIQK